MHSFIRQSFFKLLLIFCLVCSSRSIIAQGSNTSIHFQALARDSYNNPAKDRVIFIQASILQNGSNGTVLLTEEFKVTTDNTGVFDINLGQGVRVGGIVVNMDAIDWSLLPFYLKIRISITPAAPIENWDYTKDWIELGTSLIGSVPHALFAENVKGFNTKLNISDSLSIYVTPSQLKSSTDGLRTTNQAVANLSGINTGDESATSIKTKLGVSGFFSGSYNDLTNKPSLFSGAFSDLTGKPNLFGGSYLDLTNKPNIFSGAYADLIGKPILFSGNYNDLINKPFIFSGSYYDLSDKPTLFSGSYSDLANKPTLFSGVYTDLIGKPNLFSGSYNDLTNKPIIPLAQIKSDWLQTDNTKLDFINNKPVIPSTGKFNITNNNIIATNNTQTNTNPIIIGNDRINLSLESRSYENAPLVLRNNNIEQSIQLTASNNARVILGWYGTPGTSTGLSEVSVEGSGTYINYYDNNNSLSNHFQSWIFGTDGKLIMPEGGDILDYNGNSVLGNGSNKTISEIKFSDPSLATNYNIVKTDIEGTKVQSWEDGYGKIAEWTFNRSGDLLLPNYGTIVFSDGTNQNYLSDILPIPTGNVGYVLTEDGYGGASWVLSSSSRGNFSIYDNTIISTYNDPQNLNIDPVIFGNDNAKIKIQAWSESDTHTTISNSEPESTITLYSNGNGSSRLLWEDAYNVSRFSRVEVSEDNIYFRLNDDVNSYDYRWYFNNSGDLQMPAYGTIVFTDEYYNNTYLSDILPIPSGNSGYVLTEDGYGGASWQPNTSGIDNLSTLNIYNDGNYPGIFLHQNYLDAPTWLRIGNDGGGAEYGIAGASNQFFFGTEQGDVALKSFSNGNDKKLFIGATFGGQANFELYPNGNIQANGNILANLNIVASGYIQSYGNIIADGKISATALNIGSNSTTNSAALEINSTTKGFLPPRMLEIEKNNINSPVAGLMIWCTDCGLSGLGELQIFNGTTWNAMTLSIPDYTIVGSQKWSTKNLDITTYANGDKIYRATSAADFANASANGIGAYIYYDEDSVANAVSYGKLYNWFAVNDSRGLAPAGWHVPSRNEVQLLSNYLGGNAIAGGKMKEQGSKHWIGQNSNVTNISGFTGLPGGYVDYLGSFVGLGFSGNFWTSTSIVPGVYSNYYSLLNNSNNIDIPNSPSIDIGFGLSVRCIKN